MNGPLQWPRVRRQKINVYAVRNVFVGRAERTAAEVIDETVKITDFVLFRIVRGIMQFRNCARCCWEFRRKCWLKCFPRVTSWFMRISYYRIVLALSSTEVTAARTIYESPIAEFDVLR